MTRALPMHEVRRGVVCGRADMVTLTWQDVDTLTWQGVVCGRADMATLTWQYVDTLTWQGVVCGRADECRPPRARGGCHIRAVGID